MSFNDNKYDTHRYSWECDDYINYINYISMCKKILYPILSEEEKHNEKLNISARLYTKALVEDILLILLNKTFSDLWNKIPNHNNW